MKLFEKKYWVHIIVRYLDNSIGSFDKTMYVEVEDRGRKYDNKPCFVVLCNIRVKMRRVSVEKVGFISLVNKMFSKF